MTAKNVDWQNYRNWYNDRVMETYISAPIIDKQGDLIPTETLKEAMEFYMKYGIYAYKHDEIPIGVPLAYKIDDGKIKIKVGIHNKLEMHDKVWQEIKQFGNRGASSIRGEATDQRKICPDGESSCYTKIAKLGLWSVSWVGDNPANPDAKVDSVAMAKGDCCPDCGGKKTMTDYLKEEKEHKQKAGWNKVESLLSSANRSMTRWVNSDITNDGIGLFSQGSFQRKKLIEAITSVRNASRILGNVSDGKRFRYK